MVMNPKTDGNEDLEVMDEEDRPEDETAVRYVEHDKRKFQIIATDPYGLWHIQWDRGPVPNSISGVYTSPLEAENALKGYLAAKSHSKKVSINATEPSVS